MFNKTLRNLARENIPGARVGRIRGDTEDGLENKIVSN